LAAGLVAVSSAFDGPRLRIFGLGGGAGAFLTAGAFFRDLGGMVWESGLDRVWGCDAVVGEVVVGSKTLTWQPETAAF